MTITGTEPDARKRLIDAASAIFYAEGIRSVAVETILVSANVTRSTMYRYFHTKEDLALVYLEAEDVRIRGAFATAAASATSPAALLDVVVAALSDEICGANFRGCPFMNAGIEYPDPTHPIRHKIAAHRNWFAGALEELLTTAGHPNPVVAAHALVALRDGAMMGGYFGNADAVTDALRWAAASLITTR
jgi:AcrR family transcriptional regulator